MKRQIVDADLADDLHADSGLRDITGSPLTVLEALKRGLIDTRAGQVSDSCFLSPSVTMSFWCKTQPVSTPQRISSTVCDMRRDQNAQTRTNFWCEKKSKTSKQQQKTSRLFLHLSGADPEIPKLLVVLVFRKRESSCLSNSSPGSVLVRNLFSQIQIELRAFLCCRSRTRVQET